LLKADCYFADPYSSWQRGSNENTNGLIRQYFPKKTDFTTLSDKEIAEVERKLNNRPRKRLGFKSPNQVFNEGNLLNQKTS
jgi:IS30 family transposase